MKKAYLNWSSGKDAAFALFEIQKKQEYSIELLVTTLNSEVDRISMHGVKKELLDQQAQSLQIPLHIIPLEGNVSMDAYNKVMLVHTQELVDKGFLYSLFGDIFLEDLKEYRETQLKKMGITGVFPLWKRDTTRLITEFIEAGFKAITVCVNSRVLDKSYCGRIIDKEFVNSLPKGVDPCGENGEFHTFVFDGPNFKDPVNFEIGEVVEKFYQPSSGKDDCFKDEEKSWDTSFYFCDLLPVK